MTTQRARHYMRSRPKSWQRSISPGQKFKAHGLWVMMLSHDKVRYKAYSLDAPIELRGNLNLITEVKTSTQK